ncbi:MAG: hypothetical protein AAF183_17855 [Pseudomonadota bacterium]
MAQVFLAGSPPPMRPSGIRLTDAREVLRTLINLTGYNTGGMNEGQIGAALASATISVTGTVNGTPTTVVFDGPTEIEYSAQLPVELPAGEVDAVTNALP